MGTALHATRVISRRERLLDATLIRMTALVILLSAAAAFEALRVSAVSSLTNGDIWWHLQTGVWIVRNHAFPHSGIYSQAATRAWADSSWGYDLLVALGYKLVGLRFLPILLMAFKVLLATATFVLAGGLRGRFWTGVSLSAITQYVLGSVVLDSGDASILLFAVEVFLLNEIRRGGLGRYLFWLPALFLVWVNLDGQFVYGILLLALFVVVMLLEQVGRGVDVGLQRSVAPPRDLGIALALCVGATFLNPYLYHGWKAFFANAVSPANEYFPEFHAMSFHRPQDYIFLLLIMTAFLALGLRRSRDPFLISLLVGCTLLSFHAQRDTWLGALASIVVIAEILQSGPARTGWSTVQNLAYTTLSVLVVFLVAAVQIPGRDVLLSKIGRSYPVQACDYIRLHKLPRPLFNAYEWGGFLLWKLPEYPVAIDGRAELYGDEFNITYAKAMNADIPYTAFPAMAEAATLLLRRGSLMADALSTVPGFQVAYSDDIAVVLQKQD